MHYHKRLTVGHAKAVVGDAYPPEHVQAVLPPHLLMIARTTAIAIEFGQEYIVVHLLIDLGPRQHIDRTIGIAMNNHSHLVAPPWRKEIDTMQTVATGIDDDGVV